MVGIKMKFDFSSLDFYERMFLRLLNYLFSALVDKNSTVIIWAEERCGLICCCMVDRKPPTHAVCEKKGQN